MCVNEARNKFALLQQQNNPNHPAITIQIDCPTRWGSLLNMLVKVNSLHGTITETLCQLGGISVTELHSNSNNSSNLNSLLTSSTSTNESPVTANEFDEDDEQFDTVYAVGRVCYLFFLPGGSPQVCML